MNTIANQSVAPVCGSGRFIARSLVVAGLLAVLAGCSLTPEYQQPVAPVPSTISEAPKGAPAADLAISLQGWRDVFFDPQLQGQYAAGVMASYDLDFFGRLRSLSTEALENYLATEAAHRSAHVSLVSEIASAYLSWVGDSQLLELAQNTQATRERTVALVERQYQVGVATQLDLSQAKGALHDARSRTAEFDRLVQQDINALQFLTGSAEPLQLTAAPDDLGGIVKLADIPAALPSRVLL